MMLHSVSWGAVFAGAVASLITQVILNMLGPRHRSVHRRSDGQRNAGGELPRPSVPACGLWSPGSWLRSPAGFWRVVSRASLRPRRPAITA